MKRWIALWSSFRSFLTRIEFFFEKKIETPDFLNEKGKELFSASLFDDALDNFNAALAISPCYLPARINKGAVLAATKNPDAALQIFDSVLLIEPRHLTAHYNKGLTLLEMNFSELALESFDTVLSLNPNYAEAHNGRGVALKNMGRLRDALDSFNAGSSINPDYVDANWNRSLSLLMSGRYGEGWRLYEWRWGREEIKAQRRFHEKSWLGENDVSGKTVLIYPEQGFGDYIQFCRYATLLNDLGAHVILLVPAALVSIVSTMKMDIDVIEEGGGIPSFDYQCPIMSLPLAFRTEVASIPAAVPYLFSDSLRTIQWQNKLGEKKRPRIGLVWSGNATHTRDYDRSIPLSLFRPILDLPLEFHSLQIEVRSNDLEALSLSDRIALHTDELDDFADTAGLVEAMDLVISVDTSVAHLAGAMGKPVWILLSFVPDFRWMLERSDSPWYPTATLFRQPKIGDWKNVISELEKNLRCLYPG
jgi:hypothetical protein